MTGWLPEGTSCWGGRPVARTASEATVRRRAVVTGTILSVRARHWAGAFLEAVLDDGTGQLVLSWTGRGEVPGITRGATVTAEGTVLEHHGRRVLLNPLYRFSGGSSSTS